MESLPVVAEEQCEPNFGHVVIINMKSSNHYNKIRVKNIIFLGSFSAAIAAGLERVKLGSGHDDAEFGFDLV